MKTKKIQRRIKMYAILAVVLIAVTIAVISITPLYSTLRDTEQRDLIFARDTSVLIVDEYVSRIKDIARQISSRTKARRLVEDYESGKINKREMQAYLTTILNSALINSSQIIGISRINNKGQILTAVGKPISPMFWPKEVHSKRIQLYGPYVVHNHYYLSVLSPIYAPNKKRIGADVSLFDITDLQSNIHEKMQYRLGNILISYIENNEVHVLSPVRSDWENLLRSNNVLNKSIVDAIHNKESGLISGNIDGNTVFIAYAPVHQSSWGIAVIIKKSALYSSIEKILWMIVIAVIVVTLLFIVGLTLILKPLSGKVLLHNIDLENQIEKGKEELKEVNEKLQFLVDHDYLTDILNRRGFEETLSRELSYAQRHNESFTIFYIDVDNFKRINDEMGHDAGDYLLKKVSQQLTMATRKEDVIARLGGDEFAVIAKNLDENGSKELLNKITHLTQLPIRYENQSIQYTVSTGYAIYPTDGKDLKALIKKADLMMYQAKKKK